MKKQPMKPVKITRHAYERIRERFGDLPERELTDLVRKARLDGLSADKMPDDIYQYALSHGVFRYLSNRRQIRYLKGGYFVFESGTNCKGAKVLITVILYEKEEEQI